MSEPLPFVERPPVEATVLLADAAEVAEGRLFVLGGGLTVIGPHVHPVAVAVALRVPAERAGEVHRWRLELLDDDARPVFDGGEPVGVGGRFEATRPPGTPDGTALSVPLAVNFAALALAPGRHYAWRLLIDGVSRPEWHLRFSVRA